MISLRRATGLELDQLIKYPMGLDQLVKCGRAGCFIKEPGLTMKGLKMHLGPET
jgi:hypothetical protein